jgi:uncharacterized protein YbaR (Trm112 family)
MSDIALNKELLDLLCCPECKGDLEYSAVQHALCCQSCGARYPVNDDIPLMFTNRSEPSSNLPKSRPDTY